MTAPSMSTVDRVNHYIRSTEMRDTSTLDRTRDFVVVLFPEEDPAPCPARKRLIYDLHRIYAQALCPVYTIIPNASGNWVQEAVEFLASINHAFGDWISGINESSSYPALWFYNSAATDSAGELRLYNV